MLADTIKHTTTAPFRDVLVVVTSTEADGAALAAAEQLAGAPGAHGTALLAAPLPTAFIADDGYGSSSAWATAMAILREDAEKEGQKLATLLSKQDIIKDIRSTAIESFISRETVMVSARHTDIVVFTRPPAEGGDFQMELIQAALFGAGRPLLLIPQGWRKGVDFKRILVAWNGSREAARALGDAAGFVEAADRVIVATVDARPSLTGVGDAPGADIATHLARHGVKVELRNVDGLGRGDGERILEMARDTGSDLIILGGYGHSRMREMVFGGVTKHLLRHADTPIFISH